MTIDDPYSLKDTSATVMIAYGFVKGYQLGLLPEDYLKAGQAGLDWVLRNHFDFYTGTLQHQQKGPLIVNVASPNPRYLGDANPYGQGFLAQLYTMCVGGLDIRSLEVKQVAEAARAK